MREAPQQHPTQQQPSQNTLVERASTGMQSISDALNGEMAATGGGTVDAAKVQGYVMQMTNYDNIMKMAAKLHEKEDEAVKVWLR